MGKRIAGLLMTMALLVAVPFTVSAETINGSSDWQVSFNGSQLSSNFSSSNLDEVVYGILPGDSAVLEMTLKNSGTKSSNWYMENEILNSFEDGSAANGGAYTYILSYTSASGETTEFYNSETVGGEGQDGLHGATDSLEDYFFVGTIAAGSSGVIRLQVTLDGETQGNDYQNTLARLRMNFAAEETAEAVNTNTVITTTKNAGSSTKLYTVKTGDYSNTGLYLSLAALAGGLLLVLIIWFRVKRKKEDEGGQNL